MTRKNDVQVIDLSSPYGEQAMTLRKRYWVDEYRWKESDGSHYETDEFDPQSGHFGYVEDGHLVGYCRFIPNEGTLPLVKVFPSVQQVLDDKGAVCGEYSRLILDPAYRGKDLSLSFFRAVFHWAYPRQLTCWLFEVEQWMIDLFRSLYFSIEVLDQPVFYKGANGHPDQWTFPVLLDVMQSLSSLESGDQNLYHFFVDALPIRSA